jgi:methyltransferase (TIGR00027 family)
VRGRSRTAQYVALVRTILTEKGAVDDPYARAMLTPLMRASAVALPRVGRYTDTAFFAALVGRTWAFDDAVVKAMDDGAAQIVTIGAGYDSRAWRLARPGVTFFEVDHPATQADKRRRCPPGGPTFVALDLTRETVVDALGRGGLDWSAPALFVIEGVTMYLERDEAHALLRSLVGASAGGSRLAVNFVGTQSRTTAPSRRLQMALSALGRFHGEPYRSASTVDDPVAFVEATGWNKVESVNLRDRARQAPHGTLDVEGINAAAAMVVASC